MKKQQKKESSQNSIQNKNLGWFGLAVMLILGTMFYSIAVINNDKPAAKMQVMEKTTQEQVTVNNLTEKVAELQERGQAIRENGYWYEKGEIGYVRDYPSTPCMYNKDDAYLFADLVADKKYDDALNLFIAFTIAGKLDIIDPGTEVKVINTSPRGIMWVTVNGEGCYMPVGTLTR